MGEGARTCRLRGRLSRLHRPATTAQQLHPVASQPRRAGPPAPSTAADAVVAFLTSAHGHREGPSDRLPGVELAANREVMSAPLDFLVATVTAWVTFLAGGPGRRFSEGGPWWLS